MLKILSVFLLTFSVAAAASPEPQSIALGGGKLIPLLDVVVKHDDNIFSQSFNEESDTITQLEPSVQWLQEKDKTRQASP